MSFWPLFVAANCFMFDYLLPVYLDSEAANINTGGQNYLYYSDSITSDQDRWKFYTAVVSSSVASLLYSWSVYDAESDFCSEYNQTYTAKYGEALGLDEILAAPWKPENVLNFDFFPAYPMFAFLSFTSDDYLKIGSFFKRESVNFFGCPMRPAAGAALALGSSLLLANFSTLAEEISFRGDLLRNSDIHYSSIIFGVAHLPNIAIPNVSVEETVLQSLFCDDVRLLCCFKDY